MKVGFVITYHCSNQYSPINFELLKRTVSSIIENIEYSYNIIIIDNQSEGGPLTGDVFSYLNRYNIHYYYIQYL